MRCNYNSRHDWRWNLNLSDVVVVYILNHNNQLVWNPRKALLNRRTIRPFILNKNMTNSDSKQITTATKLCPILLNPTFQQNWLVAILIKIFNNSPTPIRIIYQYCVRSPNRVNSVYVVYKYIRSLYITQSTLKMSEYPSLSPLQ